MFNFRDFIMKGFRDAVGKQADYWVILNASAWMEKGVLTQADLAELNVLIETKNYVPPVPEDLPADPEGPATAEEGAA